MGHIFIFCLARRGGSGAAEVARRKWRKWQTAVFICTGRHNHKHPPPRVTPITNRQSQTAAAEMLVDAQHKRKARLGADNLQRADAPELPQQRGQRRRFVE